MGIEIRFDEFGDEFDEPCVVRCVRPLDVLSGGDGERLRVEAGTEWEVYSPGYENDVRLEGTGEMGEWALDLSWDALDGHFEMIREGRYYDYD